MMDQARDRAAHTAGKATWRGRSLAANMKGPASSGRMMSTLVVIATLPTFLAVGAQLWWPFELCTHFRAYFAVGLTGLTVVAALMRRWKEAVAALLVAALNMAHIAPLYIPPRPVIAEGAKLRVMSANIMTRNRDYRRFLDEVARQDPDVLLVLEPDWEWREALSGLEQEYPHGFHQMGPGNFGFIFFSRVPLREAESIPLGSADIPSLHAVLDVEGTSVTLIGTHPLPPVSTENAALRNSQLADVATAAAAANRPAIVLGDLNVTPWSPVFHDLLHHGELRDARRGFGVQPTWNAAQIWIPIDHVLVSQDVAVRDFHAGSDIGSDHLPVVAELQFPNR